MLTGGGGGQGAEGGLFSPRRGVGLVRDVCVGLNKCAGVGWWQCCFQVAIFADFNHLNYCNN